MDPVDVPALGPGHTADPGLTLHRRARKRDNASLIEINRVPPMKADSVETIKRHPLYAVLVAKRKRFALILTIVMLAIYYGFILVIAFSPKILAVPLSAGSVMTVGIPVGVLIILSAFVLTGIYVVRANGEFDRLTKAIREDLQ